LVFFSLAYWVNNINEMGSNVNSETNVPTRFSWKMRFFLISYLFYMVYSCLTTSVFLILDWKDDYKMESHPLSPPTRAEIEEIASGQHSEWDSISERYLASAGSLATFFIPGMDRHLAQDLKSTKDYFKLPLLWMETRMMFVGEIIGIGQRWEMFSPNVFTEYSVPRYELVFTDSTKRTVRADCDPPEDLLTPVYPFWFRTKVLRPCYLALSDSAVRMGMMNHYMHLYDTNHNGSALKLIRIYEATYHFLPIGEKPKEWYSKQSGPPASQVKGPIWEYNVKENVLQEMQGL